MSDLEVAHDFHDSGYAVLAGLCGKCGRTREAPIHNGVDDPVYPERWIPVWRNGTGYGWATRDGAVDAINTLDPHHDDIVGVLHLHPDGTTTMEQP